MVQRSCGHRNIISDWEAVKHALYSTNILLLPGESEKEDAYLHPQLEMVYVAQC